MKSYNICYKVFVGEDVSYGERNAIIDASSLEVALRKLERNLKKTWGLAYRRFAYMSHQIIAYF